LSCETGLIPRCRSHSAEEKATSSHGEWLAWEEPRAVGDLVHVEKFFARNLGGLIHARSCVPGRLGKASAARRACTWMRSRMRPYYRGSDRTKGGDIQRRSWREGPHPRGTADRRPWFGLCAELPRRSDWRLYAELRAGPHRLLADVRPEGGARCVSSARRDLCGGRGVILVPTATHLDAALTRSHRYNTYLRSGPVRAGEGVSR
jgi:hypothetical protein